MKLRTKLVLLLSAALVVTMGVSTWLRLRWTRQALEANARQQATDTALDIASDLERHLREDSDDDDISERLKFEIRRHRAVANIEFSFDSDEGTTVNYHLAFTEEEPQIKHTARPQHRGRPANVRRDDARRALDEHGDAFRPPGERVTEPLWRTPERADSSRWALLAPRQTVRRPSKPLVVDLRAESERQGQRHLDVTVPVDPEGPRKGQLTVRVSLESIDRLIRTETMSSGAVTSAAVALLMLITALIVQRMVGKPVAELEGAMRTVEEGDLSRRVVEGRADEIGALSRGFNSMLARLSEANDEIQAFNRRLADEVRAATIDLERKNEALGQLNRLLVETRRELGDKERLAVLGQLAAKLAHEIGTPLGSVSGHLQLAVSTRDLPSPLKDRLLVATRELERISKIVRDYLDSTRPVKPDRIACDVPRVIDEAVGIALGAVDRPELQIERQVATGAVQVDTDPGLLRQILVNLIANAIDAVSRKGRVAVEAMACDARVAIAVRDDGSGIGAEDLARIFEPFYTTKGRGKGTGLGLAICRELAVALGGQITVSSTLGEGSVFTVELPRPDRQVESPGRAAPGRAT